MKHEFIKVTYLSGGAEWTVALAVDEITRLSYDFNILEVKTPFLDGSNTLQLSQDEFKRVKNILLER
ncbi:hypothetical protein ACVRZG_02745 [Streptococcus hyovaginalis]|uniref:hypothetical protein n=1 Tax=Streptococcus hyovaginalis TaxID=149015 RepID=UPI0004132A63|nr:hypothetical protein [Streptococcus hyovaginalis]QBX25442.1 hypothetical protein Javan258_0035 [Streptococcus phage Javan258]